MINHTAQETLRQEAYRGNENVQSPAKVVRLAVYQPYRSWQGIKLGIYISPLIYCLKWCVVSCFVTLTSDTIVRKCILVLTWTVV